MRLVVKLGEDAIITLKGTAGRKIMIRDCKRYSLPMGTLINDVITDEEQFKLVLKQIRKRYGPGFKRIHLVLGSNQIPAKVMQVPNLSKSQLNMLVEKELEHYKMEEKAMVYDYSVVRRSDGNGVRTILAAAIPRGRMDDYRKLFAECKMVVASVDIALNALIHMVEYLPDLMGKTYLLSVLDGRNMLTLLYINGVYRHTGRSRFLHERGSVELIREVVRDIEIMGGFANSLEGGAFVPTVYFGGIEGDERNLLFEVMMSELGMEGRMLMMTNGFVIGRTQDYYLADYIYATGNLLER